MEKCKLTLKFDTYNKIKFAPYEISIDGRMIDINHPECLSNGKAVVEIEKGEHTIEIFQNNLFNKSASGTFGLRVASKILDARIRPEEESPLAVNASGTLNIENDGYIKISFIKTLDDFEKTGFVKYNLKTQASDGIIVDINKQDCTLDKSSLSRWMFIHAFSSMLGILLSIIFICIGIFGFTTDLGNVGIIFIILGSVFGIITTMAIVNVLKKAKKNK